MSDFKQARRRYAITQGWTDICSVCGKTKGLSDRPRCNRCAAIARRLRMNNQVLCTVMITRGPRAGQKCLKPIRPHEAACADCRHARMTKAAMMNSPDTERDIAARKCLEGLRRELKPRVSIDDRREP